MALAAPAILEAYAVLTRLPPPHRLAPGDAQALLAESFLTGRELICLDSPATRDLLASLPEREIAGGLTYDAVIAACTSRAGARVLLTFNEAHFERLAEDEFEVVVPGEH
jgi:predicted nucleic acid-binding protein